MISDGTLTKQTFLFGCNNSHAAETSTELVGNKGAGLQIMSGLGLAVPPGFTISSKVCACYYDNDKTLPAELLEQIKLNLSIMSDQLGDKFGDEAKPLILSVRSGSAVSMPGMMDTILNIGLNDEIVAKISQSADKARFILDCYRRLIQMFSSVVFKITKPLHRLRLLFQATSSLLW